MCSCLYTYMCSTSSPAGSIVDSVDTVDTVGIVGTVTVGSVVLLDDGGTGGIRARAEST